MARYTGPKHKLARREGVNILDKESASLQRRLNVPPGVHGKKRKRPLSEFGQQLREKQKAKRMYGLLEKQFSNLVKSVQKQKGETGELLILSLETRLDNVIYRLGFAKSRIMARQLVSHGHVMVNDHKVTIPSYVVKVGDKISLSQKLHSNPAILSLAQKETQVLPFVQREGFSGKLLRLPEVKDMSVPFNVQLIVEYYSR